MEGTSGWHVSTVTTVSESLMPTFRQNSLTIVIIATELPLVIDKREQSALAFYNIYAILQGSLILKITKAKVIVLGWGIAQW
jgi:hypothetical protein